MTPDAAYQELLRCYQEEALLESCQALLGWDEVTYMPPGGVAARANQLAYLAGLQHEKATSKGLGDLLALVEKSDLVKDAVSPAAVNVREIRRAYERFVKLPRKLVEEQARIAPLAQQQWATSLQEADFASFAPWLEKTVALRRQEAECLGYKKTPYDALLDYYEPGARTADIARLFDALQAELTPLLSAIAGSRRRRKFAILKRHFPVERQHAFAMEAAVALGFDFERGRLDTSVHAFSTHIGPGDCRIAIRYNPNFFSEAFFALLHEVGHGLYEQGADPEHEGTPLGTPNSLALHESQARLWENLVGRGLSFWKYFYPRARQAFPEALGKVSLGDFYLAVNHVEPSLNRVQADEVTYNLHIWIRFELEKALLSGDLPVADVPAAWNEACKKYLGLVPPNDAEGCLQDGHWSEGLIGYFPTYTLGNLFAAQLFDKARLEIAGLEDGFAQGNFAALFEWLRDKIYRQGSRYFSKDLVLSVTGAAPDHRPLVESLRVKYSEVYGL
ncbi:MAG: carboxypeptidase M32 [Gemmataceae bacterium]|nr:carboxypeptidase M32 [Gemmataceae bacterium]MCI0737624.1 carboxypeptidase M32 [Gemmataceae bacterium]